MSAFPKMIVSSAYWRCVITVLSDAGNPPINSAFVALCIIAVSPFTTSVKTKGDNGSPCLSPLQHFISLPSPHH